MEISSGTWELYASNKEVLLQICSTKWYWLCSKALNWLTYSYYLMEEVFPCETSLGIPYFRCFTLFPDQCCCLGHILGLNFQVLKAPSTALGRYIGYLSNFFLELIVLPWLFPSDLNVFVFPPGAASWEHLRGARRIQLECKLCSLELVTTETKEHG